MKSLSGWWLGAVLCISATVAPSWGVAETLPSRAFTPGAIGVSDGAGISASTVCQRGYSRSARHPYDTEWLHYRSAMFAEYGIPHDRWSSYTVDHLIPIELGGRAFGVIVRSDHSTWDLRNVWPQPKLEAKEKDAVEDALHRAVCARRGYRGLHLTVDAADSQIARDWTRTAVGLPLPKQ